MGLADRDYTNRNYTGNNAKRNHSVKVNTESIQYIKNTNQKSILFCEYCGKKIESELVKEKQPKSKIENGLVIDETVEVIIEKQKSLICSVCGGTFCLDCVESSYKRKDTFVKTNTCNKCQEKADEDTKRNCTHKYVRKFIRKDKYFDYYEKECLYCGNKKGIAEPIHKIKNKPEPKQTSTTQTRSKSHKKGISAIIDSVKSLFK
ncbi:MAG: hypothetical protein RBT65_00995 [Methanolobus sp.]|nr:hypothetical protein [Methanolobus sp.]